MVKGTRDWEPRVWGLVTVLPIMKLWEPDQVPSPNDHFISSYFGGSGAGVQHS